MKIRFTALLLPLILVGCDNQAVQDADSPVGSDAAASEAAGDNTASADTNTQVPGDGFALTSENTKVEFVGTHTGDKPDPRKGGFEKVTGSIGHSDGKINSVTVAIDTTSLYTEIPKLTDHLKGADFFDIRQFPKAAFKSTAVQPGEQSSYTITGDMTLLGETKQISFPATATVSEGAVSLSATFEIDRTQFGMNYGPDKIEKMVSMTVTVQP